jgi:diaminopropionate ammonia-lyase
MGHWVSGTRRRESSRDDGRAILDANGFAAAEAEITQWAGYAPTPLVPLPGLADRLGVAAVHIKDEAGRFGLNSFKALGGAYAVSRLLARIGSPARDVTVTCATAGNHGRSVAWGAAMFGCRCIVFMAESVSESRVDAIRRFGADVVRSDGNYDDVVRRCAFEAATHGWHVVSDTSYPGYHEVPVDVMHGYGIMAAEIARQWPDREPPSHTVVQVGVGSLAAALAAHAHIAWGQGRPRLVTVEPTSADPLRRSLEAGRSIVVSGRLDTVMGGLACGQVSELAWEILSAETHAALAVGDDLAREAVRTLAHPAIGDGAIEAGETGAAGLAALLALRGRPDVRGEIGLDERARVLLIGSEGRSRGA